MAVDLQPRGMEAGAPRIACPDAAGVLEEAVVLGQPRQGRKRGPPGIVGREQGLLPVEDRRVSPLFITDGGHRPVFEVHPGRTEQRRKRGLVELLVEQQGNSVPRHLHDVPGLTSRQRSGTAHIAASAFVGCHNGGDVQIGRASDALADSRPARSHPAQSAAMLCGAATRHASAIAAASTCTCSSVM